MSEPVLQSNLPMVASLEVKGLFDVFDVVFETAPGGITLLFGTNGAGKSTLLRILARLLADENLRSIDEPFKWARVKFDDGSSITVDRESMEWHEKLVDGTQVTGRVDGMERYLADPAFSVFLRTKTPFVGREGRVFYRHGAPVRAADVERLIFQFEQYASTRRNITGSHHRPLASIWANASRGSRDAIGGGSEDDAPDQPKRQLTRACRLIRSDRLEVNAKRGAAWPGFEVEDVPETQLTVEWIASNISTLVRDAREQSRGRASEIDGSFFQRALTALDQPTALPPDSRVQMIAHLERLHNRLKACALATSDLALPSWPKQSPPVQAMLDLYLQDLVQKAQASEATLGRLELFVDTLNAHLVEKRIQLDLERGMRVLRDFDGAEIQLGRLSSGEQHLIVLFYYLVFETRTGGICLIDEPEISLNVDWQHRLIPTIRAIGSVSPQQFIVATHSPVVVREHEDLMRSVLRVGESHDANA